MTAKKILIVEDEETSRRILTLALTSQERELFFAKDGDEGVRMAMEVVPDIIIMDMMLPKTDGFKATQIIKKSKELKHIPVIALTARTDDYDEDTARRAGCDEYLTKPFRLRYLRERLAKYLA